MPNARILIGTGDGRAPSASTAEDAAMEYFVNRVLAGDFAPKPPIERWSPDQREPTTQKRLTMSAASRYRLNDVPNSDDSVPASCFWAQVTCLDGVFYRAHEGRGLGRF